MSEGIGEVLERSLSRGEVSRSDCLRLLQVRDYSKEMYNLFYAANKLSKNMFDSMGQVHAQVGIDYAPCPKRCRFCVFGNVKAEHLKLSLEEVVLRAKEFERAGADAIYLMTTADFDFGRYIKIGEAVKKAISPKTPLVANIGDFGKNEAEELSKTGFTAAYHVVRLREGRDTHIDPKTRLKTIEHAKKAGLKIFFCVEPVGPEHSNEEIADLIYLGKELGVAFSGAMRRTSTSKTPLSKHGEITWTTLAKIVAATRLIMADKVVAHCTHEPNLPSLLAGANLIWAETGPNPRDTCLDTSKAGGRGLTVRECRRLLWEAGYRTW